MNEMVVHEVEVVELEKPLEAWSLDECRDEVVRLEGILSRVTAETRQRQGEILTEVKARLPHGEFTSFLESVGWNPRTARLYMQKAKEPVALTPSPSPNDGRGEQEAKTVNVAVLEDEDLRAKVAKAKARHLERVANNTANETRFKVGEQVLILAGEKISVVKAITERFVTFEFEYLPNDYRTSTYPIEFAGSGAEPLDVPEDKPIKQYQDQFFEPEEEDELESFVDAEYIAEQEPEIQEPSLSPKLNMQAADILVELAEAINDFMWEQGFLWAQAKGTRERVKVEFALRSYEAWRKS